MVIGFDTWVIIALIIIFEINFKSNDEVIQDLNISTKFAEQIFAAVQSQMSASQVNDLVAHAESEVKNGFLAIPPPPVNTEVNLNLSNYAENSAIRKFGNNLKNVVQNHSEGLNFNEKII